MSQPDLKKSSAQASNVAPSAAPPITPWSTLLGRLLGAVGLVLWASAPLTYLLAEMGPLVAIKVVLGGLCIVTYLLTNRDFFRRLQGARSGGLLALSLTTVALVLTAVVGINVFVATHNHDFDLTREGLYTLSPQTVGVLSRLDADVELYGFYASQDAGYPAVDEALQRYARGSARVRAQMVDPQARPDLVSKYAITERGPRVVVVAKGRDARAKTVAEDELTNAVIRVVEQGSKVVYFLTGHGEGDITQAEEPEGYATLAQAIVADGYRVETLNLQTQAPQVDEASLGEATSPNAKNSLGPAPKAAAIDNKNLDAAPPVRSAANANAPTQGDDALGEPRPIEVPDNVGVLAILAPMHRLLAPEVAAIDRFLQRGGRVLALEESRSQSGLGELWRSWHVDVREDLIVDTNPMGRLLGLGVASPIIQPTGTSHPIVRGMGGVIMTTARSLQPLSTGLDGVSTEPLMQTGESAWGETQLRQGGTIARDENDHLPPLYVAVAASREVPGSGGAPDAAADQDGAKESRLVLFGDADWVSNRLFRLQSNEDLALNAVGWLTEQEGKVTIRPKLRAQNQLYLSGEQLGKLKFFSMDIVPVLLVAIGLGVVLVRRQR